MRRGEVWTLTDSPSARVRVVVLSADEFNEAGAAYCAPVVRSPGGAPAPPYAVTLVDSDPLSGVVLVGQTEPVSAAAPGERVGMVTGASMAQLCDALRDLFEL